MEDAQDFMMWAQFAFDNPALTPLQIHEFEEARRLSKAGSEVDVAVLQQKCKRIQQHWLAICGTVAKRGATANRMRLLANSFAGILVEEYWDMGCAPLTYVLMADFMQSLGTPEQRQAGADAVAKGDLKLLDTQYNAIVSTAIPELMLDAKHVDERLRAAVRGERLTAKPIHAGEDDDVRLKEIVEKDRAALRQFTIFFQQDTREKRIPFDRFETLFRQQSEKLLNGPSSASIAYSASGSSFWGMLGLGGRTGTISTIANLLRSNEGIDKKSV